MGETQWTYTMNDGAGETLGENGPGQPAFLLGFKVMEMSLSGDWLICRFTRKKTTPMPERILVYADEEEVGSVSVDKLKFLKSGAATLHCLLPAEFGVNVRRTLTLRSSITGEKLCPDSLDVQIPFAGRIEDAGKRHVDGWVAASDLGPGEVVEIYDGPDKLCDAALNLPRADVESKLQLAGVKGFRAMLPRRLYDGAEHEIRLYFRGRRLSSKAGPRLTVRLSPADLPPAAERFTGAVTQLNARRVSGHVIDQIDDRPVTVEILVDGELEATVLANGYVQSLRTSARTGFHGFSWDAPSELMNGRTRAISVRVAGSNHELRSPVKEVSFPLVALSEPRQANGDVMTALAGLPAKAKGLAPAPVSAPALVSLVVINWNGADLLRALFASLAQVEFRDPIEVVLVDHGSEDESVQVATTFADRLTIRVVQRGSNHSFSSSNNLGASQASGDYLAFCNNDMVFVEDCLAKMKAVLAADPSVGLVGARLLEPRYDGPDGWSLHVHHTGIQFDTGPAGYGRRPAVYFPVEMQEPSDPVIPRGAERRPAVTAALALMRKADFMQAGGFDEGYQYGYEDVDLALRLSQGLGLASVCCLDAVAIHNRSATREWKSGRKERDKAASLYNDRTAQKNRELFYRRFARHLPRAVISQLLGGERQTRARPLRVTFAVTATSFGTAAGDYFTAHEMGLGLAERLGCEVMFLHYQKYDVADTDVLVVMRHDYDLSKVANANPGMITVAWIRNRVPQWLECGHLDSYQVLFASSRKASDEVHKATGRRPAILPIAANFERFSAGESKPNLQSDLCFTGHYWGHARDAVEVLEPRKIPYSFSMWGQKWDEHPIWSRFWRGLAPYQDLPDIYASAKLVIDDSHPVTREWDSLNSRVFDALAAGALVLTNCAGGAQDLFGGRLPSFSSPEDLKALVDRYMENPQEREGLARALQEEVRTGHTYAHRAQTFAETLIRFLSGDALRIAIKAPAPDHATKHQWGDHHFAHALKRALERRGHLVRVDILPDWYGGLAAADEVVIVLRGLSRYQPFPNAINILWLISHPDDVTFAELAEYDHVFVASEPLAKRLGRRLGPKVSALLQCTDPAVFREPAEAEKAHNRLLFVGNSRGHQRQILEWAVARNLEGLAVYGSGWTGILPPAVISGEHIPNDELYRYYGGAGVVLNDHWPDMAAEGIISNRIFDAAACGAAIITDPAEGLREVFGDAVTVCESKLQLKALVDKLTNAKDRRKKVGRLRRLVLENHTFDHRAARILDVVQRLRGAGDWLEQPRASSTTASPDAVTAA
jgi:GT2 family glycosyltransferase/spore maturation protein CgeB